jgi:hypothetical protein
MGRFSFQVVLKGQLGVFPAIVNLEISCFDKVSIVFFFVFLPLA